MARPSTWLLLAALVLAAACTAHAQQRRLMQTHAPYDDVAAADEVLGAYTAAVTTAITTSSYGKTLDRSRTSIGPSTSVAPYILPERCDVTTTSILTVGDRVGTYRLVGIPDGLGAYQEEEEKRVGKRRVVIKKKNEFILLANHEIPSNLGAERKHGAKGAFVSKWTIDSRTLKVKKGEDLIKRVYLWDWATKQYVRNFTYPFGRFCSADLPEQRALLYKGVYGTKEKIFMNGEEIGPDGKAFAHIVTGKHAGWSYQLPYFGWDSWENIVACPGSGKKTVVIGLDDGGGTHNAVYVYVGTKKYDPYGQLDPLDAAGLLKGKLYGIKLEDFPQESFVAMPPNGQVEFRMELVDVTPDEKAPTNPQDFQEYVSQADLEITSFARPEDGSWDPDYPDTFYFQTTANITGVTKLWRCKFDDVEEPTKGGYCRIVVNGKPGSNGKPDESAPVMLDNLVVHDGVCYLQEDPGNQDILARIWSYNIKSKKLDILARHDPALYDPSLKSPRFITKDEESSGIISVEHVLGKRRNCYMIAQQTHLKLNSTNTPLPDPDELVEGGQLLLMCLNARKCRY